MNKIQRMRMYKKFKDYVTLTLALLLNATCYNIFLLPLNIVSGGSGGVATIAYYAFGIDASLTIFILAIICLILCWIFLGKDKTAKTAYASIIFPVLIKLTGYLFKDIILNRKNIFVIVIFAGVISGIGNGLIYKSGYNAGGLSAINQILYEKLHIAVGKTSFIINMFIVLAASYYFGTTKAMYAIIFLYINNIVLDKVLLGISNNKAFYIVTSEPDKISDYIIETLGHDTTQFDVKGGFLEKKKKVILTVIPSTDYYKVKEGIKVIDDNAFFVATDSYEVKGAT